MMVVHQYMLVNLRQVLITLPRNTLPSFFLGSMDIMVAVASSERGPLWYLFWQWMKIRSHLGPIGWRPKFATPNLRQTVAATESMTSKIEAKLVTSYGTKMSL